MRSSRTADGSVPRQIGRRGTVVLAGGSWPFAAPRGLMAPLVQDVGQAGARRRRPLDGIAVACWVAVRLIYVRAGPITKDGR